MTSESSSVLDGVKVTDSQNEQSTPLSDCDGYKQVGDLYMLDMYVLVFKLTVVTASVIDSLLIKVIIENFWTGLTSSEDTNLQSARTLYSLRVL